MQRCNTTSNVQRVFVRLVSHVCVRLVSQLCNWLDSSIETDTSVMPGFTNCSANPVHGFADKAACHPTWELAVQT